jgi:hypothetical protein
MCAVVFVDVCRLALLELAYAAVYGTAMLTDVSEGEAN